MVLHFIAVDDLPYSFDVTQEDINFRSAQDLPRMSLVVRGLDPSIGTTTCMELKQMLFPSHLRCVRVQRTRGSHMTKVYRNTNRRH